MDYPTVLAWLMAPRQLTMAEAETMVSFLVTDNQTLRAACEALVAEERIYDYLDCALCDAPIDRKSQANGGPDVPLEQHDADCPWRMAKEALAQ